MDKGEQTVSLQKKHRSLRLAEAPGADSAKIKLYRKCIAVIRLLYSSILSPILHIFGGAQAGACRYPISCSCYAEQALVHKGLAKGIGLSFLRILSCNPWMKPHPRLMTVSIASPAAKRAARKRQQ